MHQLENQKKAVGFHRSEMFAIADDHLGNADLARAGERLMQKRVGFFAAFLRLEEIRFVEEFRIDLRRDPRSR